MRTRWVLVLSTVAFAAGAVFPSHAAAAETVSGTGEHEPALVELQGLPGESHEVIENSGELTFPVDGGPFTGSSTVVYRHTINHGECVGVYRTTIVLTYSGTFDADTHDFTGSYTVEQGTVTEQECPEQHYAYAIQPLEGSWAAQLDPRNGRITELSGQYQLVVDVDPSAVASLTDGGSSSGDSGTSDSGGSMPGTVSEAAGRVDTGTPGWQSGDWNAFDVFPHEDGFGIHIGFDGAWPPGRAGEPVDLAFGLDTPDFSTGIFFIGTTAGTFGEHERAPMLVDDGFLFFVPRPFTGISASDAEVIVAAQGLAEQRRPLPEALGDVPTDLGSSFDDIGANLPQSLQSWWKTGELPAGMSAPPGSGGSSSDGSGGSLPWLPILIGGSAIGGGTFLWRRFQPSTSTVGDAATPEYSDTLPPEPEPEPEAEAAAVPGGTDPGAATPEPDNPWDRFEGRGHPDDVGLDEAEAVLQEMLELFFLQASALATTGGGTGAEFERLRDAARRIEEHPASSSYLMDWEGYLTEMAADAAAGNAERVRGLAESWREWEHGIGEHERKRDADAVPSSSRHAPPPPEPTPSPPAAPADPPDERPPDAWPPDIPEVPL